MVCRKRPAKAPGTSAAGCLKRPATREHLRKGVQYTAYACRACHQVLPEDCFNAERLATWCKHRKYDQILCLQCAPGFETRWWEKKADKTQYSCSVCSKALPRLAYSADGFSTPKAIICKDCNRGKVVEQKHLEEKRMNCTGPCGRQQLTHHEFTAPMLLKKDFQEWICKDSVSQM